jgi:hypothetical protein
VSEIVATCARSRHAVVMFVSNSGSVRPEADAFNRFVIGRLLPRTYPSAASDPQKPDGVQMPAPLETPSC